jgi:uncharacterized protein YbgA (DUF1722 family)/uncharacterized protein YbbK (DUF523 family)
MESKMQLKKIPVGISSCLLGQKVRFDGGHKEDRYITKTLSNYIQWLPVCPEVEMGLPVPRENIRLVKVENNIRLLRGKTQKDYTEQMQKWAENRLNQLKSENLCGYILKRSSPSCGMERVRVYNPKGIPEKNGVGIYAQALKNKFPNMPIEEEGRLNDAVLLENFIERVFAYYRLKNLIKSNPSAKEVIDFHTSYKLILMAHSPVNYKRLGQYIASIDKIPSAEFLNNYVSLFMKTLSFKATLKKHSNVLLHVMGYFKNYLDKDDKQECLDIIEKYRLGYVPLIVPITILKHHLRRNPLDWLVNQNYFNPYPEELMLRNKI